MLIVNNNKIWNYEKNINYYHGEGKKIYVDGTIEEGTWNEGELVEKNIIQEIESLLNSIFKNNWLLRKSN